jgi:long-chain acyl-CoA synthetase
MRTIYKIFREVVNRLGDKTALLYKYDEQYEAISYKSLNDNINCFKDQLDASGLKKGDKVAIISSNRPEWVITDLATIKLGAVLVPIYETLSSSEIKYILNDAEVKVLIAEEKYLDKVRKIKFEVPTLVKIIVINKDNLTPDEESFACIARTGNMHDTDPGIENESATIVYTSGTTGKPKGVVLSQENIITNALALIERGQVTEQDTFLSFLPLSHMYERTVGYYAPLFAGATIAYAQNINTIAENMLEILPTIMNVVPRLLEKMYEKIWDTVNNSPIIKENLFRATINNKNAYKELLNNAQSIPLVLDLKCKLLDVLVCKKIRNKVGGRLRFFTSGGASLKKDVTYFFENFGIKVLEGYGLTETSPVLTSNSQDDYKIGSVGKPLPNVKIKINERDSEVLAKSPGIMLGYYRNKQATDAAIDEDGWFHTGDIGCLDDDGYLWITGRLKELIISSYGQNISPNYIEEQLLNSKFIDQVIVYGDGETHISALIVPNKEHLKKKFLLEDPINWQEMLQSEPIYRFIGSELEKHSINLARYERIKQFVLLEEAFSVENGLLTPTLKLKRKAVLKHYSEKLR